MDWHDGIWKEMIQNIVATAVTCQHLDLHYNFDIAACKFPNLTLVL